MDHIVKEGETQSTYKLEIFPGGKGLNQTIAIARAGAQVYHAGCIGNDGDMLADILIESGADVSYIRKVDEKTGHAIIQVDSNGQNAIFLCGGANEMITDELVDSVLEQFGRGDIILLQKKELLTCKRGIVTLKTNSPDQRIPLFIRHLEQNEAKQR